MVELWAFSLMLKMALLFLSLASSKERMAVFEGKMAFLPVILASSLKVMI